MQKLTWHPVQIHKKKNLLLLKSAFEYTEWFPAGEKKKKGDICDMYFQIMQGKTYVFKIQHKNKQTKQKTNKQQQKRNKREKEDMPRNKHRLFQTDLTMQSC